MDRAMDIVVAFMLSASASAIGGVVRLFRAVWPQTGGDEGVEGPNAAAAVLALTIVAPVGYVAYTAARLGMFLFQDDMLLFLALFVAPFLLLGAVLAGAGVAAGVAIAIGIAAGVRTAVLYAWAIVVLGAIEVVTAFELDAPLVAGLLAAATAAEALLLVPLSRRDDSSYDPARWV
jgi:hypothetical protein